MYEALIHVQDNLPNGVRLTFRPDAEAGLTTNGSSDALVQCGTTPASRRPALMANSIDQARVPLVHRSYTRSYMPETADWKLRPV